MCRTHQNGHIRSSNRRSPFPSARADRASWPFFAKCTATSQSWGRHLATCLRATNESSHTSTENIKFFYHLAFETSYRRYFLAISIVSAQLLWTEVTIWVNLHFAVTRLLFVWIDTEHIVIRNTSLRNSTFGEYCQHVFTQKHQRALILCYAFFQQLVHLLVKAGDCRSGQVTTNR